MAASDTALLQQMDDYILDGKHREATDAYCQLVAAHPENAAALTTHVITTAAPYLHVPAHHKLLPNGEFRNVNYDHTILGIRAGMRLMPWLSERERYLTLAQAMYYVPQGLDVWAQLECGFPGHYAREQERCAEERVAGQQAPALPLRGPGAAGRGLGGRALPAHVRGHRGRRQGDELPALPRPGRPARAAGSPAQRGAVRRHHRPAGVQLVPQGPPHRAQGHPHPLDARHRRLGGLGARPPVLLRRRAGPRQRADLPLALRPRELHARHHLQGQAVPAARDEHRAADRGRAGRVDRPDHRGRSHRGDPRHHRPPPAGARPHRHRRRGHDRPRHPLPRRSCARPSPTPCPCTPSTTPTR